MIRNFKFSIILGVLFLILGTLSPYFTDFIPFFREHEPARLALAIVFPLIGVSIGSQIDKRLQASSTADLDDA